MKEIKEADKKNAKDSKKGGGGKYVDNLRTKREKKINRLET